MKKTKITRRRFVATTAAASATMIAAPFVRTANAAGKLSIGFWDHWVPGANKATEALVQGMGRQGEGRGPDRLHHLAGQQDPADHRRRGAGQVRPRHPGHADLVAAGPRRTARAGQRHHGAADQAERRGQRHRRVSRQDQRQVARRAGDGRQPDQGAVLAHRPHEAARRHRRAGDVSGRRAAQGRQLDPRHLPEGGRSLPQGRLPVRHRPRHDVRLGRHGRRDLPRPSAPSWSMPRATSRSRPTRCARRSTTTSSWRSSCRPTRRHGTTPPTTSGWSPARAR